MSRELKKVWKSRGLPVSYRALRLDTFISDLDGQETKSWQVHWGTCDPYTSWDDQEISSRWFQSYSDAKEFYLSIKRPRGISRYCDY